jgi:hypothetical protein
MRRHLFCRSLAAATIAAAIVSGHGDRARAQGAVNAPVSNQAGSCPVTAPNGHRPQGEQPSPRSHGNDALTTVLWPESGVQFQPGGPGCVEPNGYLGMKFPWWRGVRGALTVEGRRLDGEAGPLYAHVPSGYGPTGFQATGLLFAGPGCWEVTGHVGGESLTFVTLVTKMGDGPAPRCSALFGGFRSGDIPGGRRPNRGDR